MTGSGVETLQTFFQLLKSGSLKSGPTPKLTCLIVPDWVRRQRAVDRLRLSLVGYEITQRQAHQLPLETLRSQSLNLSLFSTQRAWIIDGIEALNAADLKLLIGLIQTSAPADIFITTAPSLPAKHALRQWALQSDLSVVVESDPLKGTDLKRWIAKEASRQGSSGIDLEAVERLILIGEADVDRISPLLDLIILYVGDERQINADDIAELFQVVPPTKEFELIDLISNRRSGAFESLITRIIAEGKSAFILLAILSKSFSHYLAIRSMIDSNHSSAETQQRLGVSSWIFNKHLNTCKRYDLAGLVRCLSHLAAADSDLKNKSVGHEAIMHRLCRQLVTEQL